jgi:hypothetical protein
MAIPFLRFGCKETPDKKKQETGADTHQSPASAVASVEA